MYQSTDEFLYNAQKSKVIMKEFYIFYGLNCSQKGFMMETNLIYVEWQYC